MRDELFEKTNLIDAAFPINIFHLDTSEPQLLYLHWHEHYEILVMKKGETIFHINGKRFEAKAGDILFVNSGELHAAISELPNHVQCDAIVFHHSLIDRNGEANYQQDASSPYLSRKVLFENIIKEDHPKYQVIKGGVDSLTMELKGASASYQLAVQAYCQLIFTWLNRWFTVKQREEVQLDALKEKVERFKPLLLFVEKNYADKITVEQAASLVNVSTYHFCKVFKELTGFTFVQFLTLHRIYEADKLLTSTSMTVSEIAEQVGFSSIHRFSKIYKKIKGYSPSQQRKMI